MTLSYRNLAVVILSTTLLLGGNGLLVSIISLRGVTEGFSLNQIGLLGTGYYLGLFLGGFMVQGIVRSIGHIRVFVTAAALFAFLTLLMLNWTNYYVWLASRFLMGLSFMGITSIAESWINEAVTNENRARALSIYRICDQIIVGLAQFIIPIYGAHEFGPMTFAAMLFCLAVIPLGLTPLNTPTLPRNKEF